MQGIATSLTSSMRHTLLIGCAASVLIGSNVASAAAPPSEANAGSASSPVHTDAKPAGSTAVGAQTEDSGQLTDIVVTAQKRGVAEAAQKVPIAITALNGAALEQAQVRDLQSLNTSIPNVSLSSINTIPGFANFEIRGFGINSSIPSVEPAVGVFVDGIYLGQTSGVVLDIFDIDSIEVLRGPQGTLFGRNTTGGAVSITTRRPGDEFSIRGKINIESGPQYTAGVSVEGPLTDTLRAKVAAYTSQDQGYFYDTTLSSKVGKRSTSFVRPTVVWAPTESFDTTLIYERGSGSGDGAVVVNPAFSSGFKDVSNYPGFFNLNWESLTSESTLHVGLGDGTITSVVGIRNLTQLAGEDLDGGPNTLYHVRHFLHQNQFSGELRYAGTFGIFDLTAGGYYFQQKYQYIEERTLATLPAPSNLGGAIDQHSFAFFGQGQVHFTSKLSLIFGGRYSWEKKSAQVATFLPLTPLCNYDARTCAYNFPGPAFTDPGSHIWQKFNPKLGFQWLPSDKIQVYGTYSEGVRSGGYNVRSTALTISPGPYDEENQQSFEVGVKTDLLDRHLRINVSAFHNRIENLQRDINQPDPRSGTVQITSNVGTARINGVEAEVTVTPTRGLIIGANFGYLDGKYTNLAADLNGALPGFGTNLQLARLVPYSYGGNVSYTRDVTSTLKASARVDFGHRDRTPFTDANNGFINQVNDLSATATVGRHDDSITLAIYAKNLLNEVWNGADAPLPGSLGGGFFRPISKGRTFGAEIRFKM